ncbi:MAG: Lrp/AsnC ligand binding domain-containing protein [Candidatus Bathyarchaeia archaeon]
MTIKAYIFMSIMAGLEEEACRKLTEFEGVKEVATIFGEYDAIAKTETRDIDQLKDLILEKLRGVPGITYTATMIVDKEYQHPYQPKEPNNAKFINTQPLKVESGEPW